MPRSSPALLERLVSLLRRADAPLSSGEIAREVLGIETKDEELARRLVEPLVSQELRVRREGGGWRLDARAGDGSAPLAGTLLALFAPASVHVVAHHREGPAPAAICVCVEGADEIARARALGAPVEGSPLSLLSVARLVRGYRGPAAPVDLAHALGVRVVEDARDAPAMARLVAAAFSSLVDQLALEGITTHAALECLVEQALAEADFEGRAFGRTELEALDEGPGVYVFRDVAGEALYVGQSLCVGARVRSYFVGPPRDAKDSLIRDAAHALDVEACDSGPDALVLEARRIRRLRPRLNTRRRVLRPAERSGVLVSRDPRRDDRAVLFAVEGGRLVARGVAVGRGPRARRSVRGVLDAWRRARHAPAGGDEEAARVIATWRHARPDELFLERGLHGDDDAIHDAILALLELPAP